MKTIVVTSIVQLISHIAERVRNKNRILWFRGHRSSEWDVQPAIWRDYDVDDERNFTNRFVSRAGTRHEELPVYDDSAGWLSLMQHYGVPTRLLDWSRSPLIAVYFALEKYIYHPDTTIQEASIWILEPHSLNVLEKMGEVTPSINAHMCEEMLSPAFSHRGQENNKIFAVMAAERDLRMYIQQGCFTIHSSKTALNKRNDCAKFLSEIRIPAECIEDFAFSIDVCGYRKGDIFPDLQNLADELKGIYKPRRKKGL